MESCDYLVIGAGAAGCVVASRLSEDPANRVTLVEHGVRVRHPLLSIPGFSGLAMALPQYKTDFMTEPNAALGGRRLRWTQGRCVGGGSAINGMVYARGDAKEYDAWARVGCAGWSFDDVLPFFKRVERHVLGETALHGGAGPIAVKSSGARLPITEAFIAALAASGIPRQDDLNGNAGEGVGYHDINAGRGRRISAAVGYLEPALRRPNLDLLTNTRSLRIVFENGRACGVEVERHGVRRVLKARREVIICCGALQSPQLLMLSGIGPADRLASLGIRVEVDAPEVGRNLRNHPNFQLQYACSAPVTAYRYMHPARGAACLLAYLGRRGPLAESFFAAGGYFRTEPHLDMPDVYMVAAPALLRHNSATLRLRDLLPREEGFMVSLALGRPVGAGEVRLGSADARAAPVVSSDFLAEPDDLRRLARGVGMLRQMLKREAFSRYVSEEIQPGPAVADEAAMAQAIRERGGTSYHPLGTCRMGGDGASVVDPELRVRGVQGLRVVDASIMPTALNAPIHAPVLMIAERAAAMICAENQQHRGVAKWSQQD